MDTDFVEDIVSINSGSQTLDFDRKDSILCPDGVVNSIVKTEFFSQDDIDDAMSSDNCLIQTIESSYFTNSGTRENELNNMTRAVMESVPYADGLQYLAAISSFSDNFKEMDSGQQIKQEPIDSNDLFESSDEEVVQQMSQEEYQEFFDVQEEVVVQECPEQEIITQSWDMNRSTNINTILKTEVECMSSTDDVDIPIPEGEEASSSVNPYPCDFCSRRFNRKSHLMNHMVTHQSERPFCCALCGVRYRRKCDLANHMKIHIGPDNQSDSGLDNQNVSVTKVMNKLMFVDPIRRRSVTPGDDSEDKGDTFQEPSTKNRGRSKGRGRGKGRPMKDRLITLGWNSEIYSKPHTCNPCGISFTREKALLNHARLHHIDDGVNIVTTQKSNSDSYELTILANSKSSDVTTYSCDSCGAVFDRFDFLKRHQRQHMKKELGNVEEEIYEEAHMCIHCGLFFKSMPELEMHTDQHLIPTNISEKSKCLACGETFDSTDELSDHVSQIHTESLSENSCKLCGKLCKDDKALQKHLMVHDTSDNNCIMCGKRFHSRARLKRHMVTHREKGVICDICGEEVADKRALINHKASHANTVSISQNSLTEKVFPCTSCGKVFGSRSSQQIHIRIHTGERPYGCRYCSKAFADGGTLRKHERIHTGEKPYACPVCPKAFNQRVVLREHIRAHHAGTEAKGGQVNFYECKVCGYLFRSSTELCSHLVQHSDENTKRSRVVPVGPRKYKRRSKLGNRKDTWCLVEKVFTVMSGQSDTESCEDEPMPTVEEQAVQSIMEQNDMPYDPPTIASPPSKSPVKTYKIVNGKLLKSEQKSSKQVSCESKHTIPKLEPVPKKHCFVLKDGECTRTCSTVLYYSSRCDPTVMDSSLGEESKENDNPEEPEDQISVEDTDFTNIKIEPVSDQSIFNVHDLDNICNIDFSGENEVQYYVQNTDDGYVDQCELILESSNDDCLIETVFDTDYVEEVGANIELSTEEMAPVFAEIISCDICDEVFEDRKELMRHIQTMHIG